MPDWHGKTWVAIKGIARDPKRYGMCLAAPGVFADKMERESLLCIYGILFIL
jgi:hypothetical protein